MKILEENTKDIKGFTVQAMVKFERIKLNKLG